MSRCHFPCGGWFSLPIVAGETVLQFCKRLAIVSSMPPLVDDTSAFLIFQEGKLINSADKRHLKLSAVAKPEAKFRILTTEGGNPSTVVLVTGNLDEGAFEPALTECSICLQNFFEKINTFSGRIVMLPCRHRFHKHCIVEHTPNLCPLCRAPY